MDTPGVLQGVVAALDMSNAVALAAMSAAAQPGDAPAAAGGPAVAPIRRARLLAGAPPRRALLQAPRRLHQARALLQTKAFNKGFPPSSAVATPAHLAMQVTE